MEGAQGRQQGRGLMGCAPRSHVKTFEPNSKSTDKLVEDLKQEESGEHWSQVVAVGGSRVCLRRTFRVSPWGRLVDKMRGDREGGIPSPGFQWVVADSAVSRSGQLGEDLMSQGGREWGDSGVLSMPKAVQVTVPGRRLCVCLTFQIQAGNTHLGVWI